MFTVSVSLVLDSKYVQFQFICSLSCSVIADTFDAEYKSNSLWKLKSFWSCKIVEIWIELYLFSFVETPINLLLQSFRSVSSDIDSRWKAVGLYALPDGSGSILCIPIGIFKFSQWNSLVSCITEDVSFFSF